MIAVRPIAVDGVRPLASGQVSMQGAALEYFDSLDSHVTTFAAHLGATEERHPAMVPVAELDRVDYFEAFPHLAVLPTSLRDEGNSIGDFVGGGPVAPDGTLRPAPLGPITMVLTPAACYPVYIHHAGETAAHVRYVTTRNTCFRNEESVVALERLRVFTMREIVCLGTPQECTDFLDKGVAFGSDLASWLGLPTSWERAFDPFFRPAASKHALMQQLEPTKAELLFQQRLALASTNYHHDHFGRAFDLGIGAGGEPRPATTACLAFGWERWLSAMGQTHGPDPSRWPAIPGAAP